MKLFLLFCFCCIFFQQQVLAQSPPLVRSTTSASGSSDIVVNGDNTYVIQQSVGQPSAIGTYSNNNYLVRQGFIQPNVLAIIKDVNVPTNLQISLFPNPFDEQISLVFNEKIKGEIKITVFNILGAQMFAKAYEPNQQIDVQLGWLSSGEYILKANANQKQFISKILKK